MLRPPVPPKGPKSVASAPDMRPRTVGRVPAESS